MVCPHCGAAVQADQRFCVKCGTVLPAGSGEKPEKKLDLSSYFDGKAPERGASPRRDMDEIFALDPDRRRGSADSSAAPQRPAQTAAPQRPAQTAVPQRPAQTAATNARPAATQQKNTAGKAQPRSSAAGASPARPQSAPTKPQSAAGGKSKGSKVLDIALMILAVLAIGVVTFVLILLFWPSGDGGRDRTPSVPTVTVEPAPATETEGPAFIIEGPDASPADQGTAPAIVPTILPTTMPTAAPTPAPTADPASAYLLPDSDSRYLTEEDLKGLSHEQLCFARNEIFARHGRIFKTQQIADYFNSKSWYRGTVSAEAFQDSVFNAYERANITLIANYEKKMYGGSYY